MLILLRKADDGENRKKLMKAKLMRKTCGKDEKLMKADSEPS